MTTTVSQPAERVRFFGPEDFEDPDGRDAQYLQWVEEFERHLNRVEAFLREHHPMLARAFSTSLGGFTAAATEAGDTGRRRLIRGAINGQLVLNEHDPEWH